MNKKLGLYIAFLLATGVMSAQAEVLETNGVIGSICSFGDTTNGALTALPSLTVLSSEEGDGGNSATIAVTNNSPNSFALFISTPSAFSNSPAGYDSSEASFVTNYSLAGAGIANDASVSAGLATAGTDALTVSNRIDNGSNMFVAGAYSLTNIVTCAAQ